MESLDNKIGKNTSRLGKVLVALIAAVAMLLTGVNLTPSAVAAETVYNPDAPAVEVTSGVTVDIYKDKNHTQKFDPNTDKASVGQTFYGSISFDFTDEQKPTLDSPNRSYTFPKNIRVKDVESSTLYDKDGNAAGTWKIAHGVVTAHWNEDWLNSHPSDISSYVSFDFTLGEDAGGDGDQEHITFPGGGGDITITIDKSKVNGQKTYTINDDGTVTFTVTLKPQFDVKDMVVTDTMGSNFTFVDGSFQLDGKPVNATIDGQKATISLGDLAKADKNGYQLTYKAQLTDAAKKTLAQGGKLDDAKNTAQWNWDGADKPGAADVTPNLSYAMVQKSNGSGTASDIKWTVKLNSGSLKADMGGYVFTDAIRDGQHYTGSYTVKDAKGNTVATGRLDGSAKDFTYTFPADAGAQQYTIEYHTALDDASSTATVDNHAEVTPPDDKHPGGSDDGSYTPKDTNTYVTKKLDTPKTAIAADGKATWTSTVEFSKMAAGTDPSKVTFTDKLSEPDGATFTFDGKPTLTIGGTTLAEGPDYTVAYNKTNDQFTITFKATDALKAAVGKQDVTVRYATTSDKTPGTYKNTASVKVNGRTTSASDSYDIENTNLVSKTGSMKWDKDFDWSKIDPSDATKGAWVATWKVTVNEDDDPYNGVGKTELNGRPIVVNDTIPQGMSYVPGGTYKVQAGWNPGTLDKQNLDNVMANANGKLTFTIPTNGVVQTDGSDKAYAVLTYSTAAKTTGGAVAFTNKATADSGDTHFGEDSSTVTGDSKVIDKSAAQIKDLNRVRYTIKVNPQGADLIKNADTVTLTDMMDAEGTFIPASLKVTNSNTGATLIVPVKVEDVTDANGDPTTKLTLTLPDSTPVTVTYDVKPNGKPGDRVNLTNTATLEGVANGEDINKKDWTVTNPNSGTDGAAGSIAITKTDADDLSRKLAGAKFALYEVDMNRLSGTKVTFDQVKAVATQSGAEVTTDANGVATFGSADKPLKTNTLYYFVETAAPTGTDGTAYELDATPHYFMLPGTDAEQAANALDRAKGFGLAVSDGTSFNVYDKRKPAAVKGSVTLYKQLTGRAWTDADKFTFELAADAANSKGVSEAALKAAMPADTTATVGKTGDGADGSASPFTFGDFTFPEPGTYAYTVKETGKDGDGMTVDTRTASVTFTVTRNASGNLEIKGGQAKVEGIDENHGDWTFDNTYKPTPVTTSGTIKVQKTLTGRAWRDGDSFEFRLQPAAPTEDAPLPAGAKNGYASLTVTDGKTHAFGDITYDRAGEYHYTVFERTPTANNGEHAIPGVDYSNALYDVTVTITDDGNGKLSNDSVVMTKVQNDDGTSAGNTAVDGNVAAVTNVFKAQEANLGLLVTKKYADKTGSKPLTDGMFSFALVAKDGAPLPDGATGDSATANVTSAGVASFGLITLTSARDDGKTYEYTLKENVPDGATPNADGTAATLNGMTYDLAAYTVKVAISTTTDGDRPVLKQSVTILDEDGNAVDPSKLDNGRPVFSNTYDLTPAETSIAGRKTLTGRDMDPNETFTFRLAAASDNTAEARAARAGLKDHSIVLGSDRKATDMTQTVVNAKDGQPAAFTFDGLHFSKPGTFKFAVTETGTVKTGTQKDEHVGYVTVTVKDNGDGTLAIAPTVYDNSAATTDADRNTTDASTFTNVYAPTGYAYFLLHKKITASEGTTAPQLKAGAYTFGLYQGDGTDGKTPIQTATNTAPVDGEASGHVAFDHIDYTPASLAQAVTDGYAAYDAATKTWNLTYTAAELGPDGQPAKAGDVKDGIAYDATTRTIEVTVKDAGSGTLQTSYAISDGNPATSDDPDSEAAAFDNVYTPAPATAELHAKKQLDGRDWKTDGTDRFDFKLEAVSGTLAANKATVAKTDIPMPAGAQDGVLTHTATNGDVFGFGEMTYTKAGTYVYNISEVQPSAADAIPGVSYSTDLYRATVTVTDDGTGQLTATTAMKLVSKVDPNAAKQGKAVKADPAVGEPVATITNTYAKLSQNWSPKVLKRYTDLSGDANPLTAGKFQFTLTPVKNAPLHVIDADGTVKDATSLKAENTGNGEAAFKDVQFTDADLAADGGAKTYRYEIAEVKGSEAGMTYDDTVYTVDVTVAVDGNGYLTVTPAFKDKNGDPVAADRIDAGRPVFTNTYTPTKVDAQLKAHKTLNGATLKDGEFTFQLYDGIQFRDGDPAKLLQTKTNAANGDVTFDTIDFDKVGAHDYSIREVVPDDAVNDVRNGVTYDHTWQYVHVDVTLDKSTGKLKAAVTDANSGTDTAEFTNTYDAAGAATLGAKKDFRNSDGSARPIFENDFTFQLHEGATTTGKVLQTKAAAADGSIAFDPIAYKLSDLDGKTSKTFTYTVNEITPADNGKLPGVTYDTAAYTYTVTVTNAGNGKLTTKVAVDGKTNVTRPTFTNTYAASGSTAIGGVKKVTGDDGSDQTMHFANKFTFTLTGKDGAPIHVDGTGSDTGKLVDKTKLTASNTAAGTVSFGTLHYTLADLADVAPAADGTRSKTFTYEVAEDATTVAGVTNDATAVKNFTVTVKDSGDGTLAVTTAPADTAALFAFTNTYAASATLTLTGTKTMTGRKLTAADRYTFDVYEGSKAEGAPVSTGTSDATGTITFDNALTYTLKDLGDHTYTVVESETNLPGGVTAVTRIHTFTVNVADTDHNGTLKLTTSGLDADTDGNGGLAFENNYTTTDSTPIELKGVKLLEDGDYDTTLAQLKGKFTFTLKGKDGAPLHVLGADGKTATDETEVTARNDDAGNVDFGKVVYHFADLAGRTDRTFTYVVTESGDVAGVTNDADLTREFTVTLHDNGDGTMSATADPSTGALFSFENTYSGGATTDAFDFTKTLDGRALDKGEFTFTLTGATGADGTVAPMPEGAKDGVKTVTNAADGKVTFGEITYDKPGTYAYTVRETAGDLGGVTYDDTVYTVTVTVKDNHDGTMTATHEIARTAQSAGPDAADGTVKSTPVKDEDAVFANTYAPAPTAFTFTATKTIKGRDLKDGEFTFELRDADGTTIRTAKNSADGRIAFTPITFDKAGEYTYTIRESKGDATGVTYDTTVYTAKVTVTDNLDGTMTATAAYQSGLFGSDRKAPAFENTYTPPLSTTGAGVAMPALIALLLLGGGAAILVAERRRRDEAGTVAANGRHRR
ncbi:Spy0128 family protein [Bifidobacterium parmae]|uniref:T surface-antigen of pili n=1 Tax=Bifidobacterium parmae TaxID=361854 RepID=A0A2N5J5X9_9BIFI|nr:FctA domain-containing protein [Bifidobacterium parmae]PLS29624.1 T surface-antigen of pili [Bifidobacterium parmae]